MPTAWPSTDQSCSLIPMYSPVSGWTLVPSILATSTLPRWMNSISRPSFEGSGPPYWLPPETIAVGVKVVGSIA